VKRGPTVGVRPIGAALLVVCLAACGGGAAQLKSDIQTTTQGQQLLDLKKAYDAGAISKEEYERLGQKIVSREK
jgi:hypothetical protein